MPRLTTALLKEAAEIAQAHQDMSTRITAAFEERYGTTHSAVDCDSLIEILDYGLGGYCSLAECDRYMAARGAPVTWRPGR